MLVGQLGVAALCNDGCRAALARAREGGRELALLALAVQSVLEEAHVVLVAAARARPDHVQVGVEGLIVLGVGAVQVARQPAQQVDLLLPLEERLPVVPGQRGG